MRFHSTHISEDTSQLALTLSYEENLTALRCAQKVLKHLNRQTDQGNLKYQRNIVVVKEIIATHKRRLEELGGSIGLVSQAS